MIGALIVGLIVGAIAKLLMPGKDPGGWIITMLLGCGRRGNRTLDWRRCWLVCRERTRWISRFGIGFNAVIIFIPSV